jgi:drug/metabolite transporter (DMT)-like permease
LRHAIRLKHVGSHLVRNGVHLFATVCWMLAVTLLPLATVFALEFTMPVWVALFAVLVLGERLTVPRLATIILGFVGVCVIVRPGLETFQPAALIALAAAFTFAIVAIATKRLTRDETTFAILFWMNLLQLPLSLIFSDPLFPSQLGAPEALPVMGIIVSGLLSHFCLTNAFRAGDALIVVPMDFLRIPLIALIGWTLYGESIDVLVFVGSGFIMAGVFWNLWQESRMSKAGRET